MMWKCQASKESGLTLIEVMIAIALLAFVSIAVVQATIRAVDINYRLGSESTDYTAIALSLQAIETDLAQIYTPYITSESKVAQTSGTVANPGEYWSEPIRPDGLRRSRLHGTKEKLTFVSNGNRRVDQDSPQSDFMKVSWEIERNKTGAYTLYRTIDTDAFRYDDKVAKKSPRVPLIENLQSAKFSYFRLKNKQWEDTWDSEGAYVQADSRYPLMISLKIEVPDPTNNAVPQSWEMILKPNQPLNVMDDKLYQAEKEKLDF